MDQKPAQSLISVKGVHQSFDTGDGVVEVLRDINFDIPDNTFNIIYGASGSGKSTLLNILTGLQRPSKGLVTFGGKNIYEYKHDDLARFRAHRIGIVYQQNYWVQSLNVRENVALPLYFLGYDRSLAMDMAEIALDRVSMLSYAKKHPSLLSGGEQQRVAMARALVNDPMIIIADEPTGNLDSVNGDKIMELLGSNHELSRRTIILVTHNMEYLPLADHLLHIQDGVVEELRQDSITSTVNVLIEGMKSRIDTFAKARKRTGGTK